jgi:autotransporter-associated beta strand protein
MKPIHRPGIFGIVFAMSTPLMAQSTYVAGTGNWSTAANWNPASVPAPGTDIILSGASAAGGVLTLDGATSRTIGSYTHGDIGMRINDFSITTGTNTLTIGGGVTANGAFTAVGLRLRGNITVPIGNQTWSIGGNAGYADAGVLVQDRSSTNRGLLTLNGTITKTGTGQLQIAGATIDGPGDIVVNEGGLKLNAGSSLELRAVGTGKFILNNSSTLYLAKNSGTFGDNTTFTRAFQFNGTTNVNTSGNALTGGPWTIPSNMEWNGTHTITVDNSVGTGTPALPYQFSGVMSGTGTLTKSGPSPLTLSGTSANTISGLVTLTAGELLLDKTGAIAVPGDILVTGGLLDIVQSNQIASTSTLTLTGGRIDSSTGRTQTLAALNISTNVVAPSVSGFTITGATTINNTTTAELNSGQTFTTNSLSISDNSTLRLVGNNATGFSTINVGAGGLTLNGSRIQFGNGGLAGTQLFNLGSDLVSTGASRFTVTNTSGPRIIDLQAGSRSFAINDGSLEIQPTVQNGTLVKSGAGTLLLSRSGSTANFSFTGGPVQVTTLVDAGNVSLTSGSVQMDISGANPSKINATGDFTYTGGTIDVSANIGSIAHGDIELVRYGGTLTGVPIINLPPQLTASRTNPNVNYGTGANSAITLVATGTPLGLTWHGAAAGGLWDNNTTANFNGGAEKFFPLDSVTFDDNGVNGTVQLNSVVIPTDVVFNHGTTRPTYTVGGTGSISGTTNLTKNGIDGTTILATDNNYTGTTDIHEGVLQVGNGGLTGSLGTGAVTVDFGASLKFARDGSAVVGNVISGSGTILNSGPGITGFTANSPAFSGDVRITGGTLQLGDGGAGGSLGSAPIDISAGATFGIKLTGTPTIANSLTGDGSFLVSGSSPIVTSFNTQTGGITVNDGGVVRAPADYVLGAEPFSLVTNAIRLTNGGLKNQDSDTITHFNRGVTIDGEAYFTAGWARTLTIGGPITGTGNVFINYDSGRVIFSDTTSNWNGVLTLGADKPGFTGAVGGNLEITSIADGGVAGPLGVASADPANLVFNGGRLIYNGVAGSSNRGFTLQGAGTIDVTFDTLALSGVATGTGSLTKAGAGTLILSGTSDFVGEKIISAGSVVLASTAGLGDTASFVRFTGTTGILDLAMDTSVAPYTFTIGAGNSGTILSNRATPGAGINHTLGYVELSTVTLNFGAGANVTSGDARVTIPTLNLSAGAAGTTTLAPTTANIDLGTVTIGTGNFAKRVALSGTSLNNFASGVISDGLNVTSLAKFGDSTWTVSGNNTFTGDVTADDGILNLAHTNALGGQTKALIAFGEASSNKLPEVRFTGGISPTVATAQISGAGTTGTTGVLNNLSGNNTLNVTTQVSMRTGVGASTLYSTDGTFTLNTPLITATNTNRALIVAGPGNGVFNGVIANGSTVNLPVTKNGTGTWTLNGAHTYSGATTVNEGVLSLGQPSLNDAAAVVIATGAKLDLNFTGEDRVGSLSIDGQPPLADGLYSAATHPLFITGSGSIRVGVGGSGYASWASGYPFNVGVNDGPTQDADFDGISNILEYVLGGIPVGAGAGNTSILPTQTLTATDLILTFKRSDLSEADVTLKVQWSDNMVTWNDFATIGAGDALPAVDVTEDSPTADLDTVVVTIPRSLAPGKIFARLQAVK